MISITQAPDKTKAFAPRTVSIIGDSRSAQVNSQAGAITSLAGFHWLNTANALMGHPLKLRANYGISGNRSDQFLATNLNAALNDSSDILIFGSAAVNDISQASSGNFTNVNGVAVSMANVASVAAANIITAITLSIARGKRVIVVAETGSQSFTTPSTVGAVCEYNERVRDFVENARSVAFWDITQSLWSPTASSSAITFRANYSGDGTHPNLVYGAYYLGKAFATWLSPLILPTEFRPAAQWESNANSAYQLITNPLFSTLTGGAKAGAGTVTGNVPASWTLTPTLASTSVMVTNGSEPNGFGNTITLAVTGSAADVINLDFSPSNANYNLGDILQASIDISVAAGSSNAHVYLNGIYNTSAGAPNVFDLYNDGTNGPGPNVAYTYSLQTLPIALPSGGGVTQGYVILRLSLVLTGAGNITVTLSRPSLRRRFSL